jgi:ribosomal protein S18 acetylase RimI-like enzyme
MEPILDPVAEVSAVTLRSATVADAPVVADLVELLNVSEDDPTGYVTPATMARDLAAGRISVLLAEDANGIAGYCLWHFGYEATYAASGIYVCDLYVRPAARGRGIGRALLAEVARRAKAEGGCFVWWTAKPQNEAANAFYAGLGGYQEPVIAHAVFDDAFDRLVAAAEARATV